MAQQRMVDAYVRSILQEVVGDADLQSSGGTYRVAFELDESTDLSLMAYVADDGPATVSAMCPAVVEAPGSTALLEALNDINTGEGPPHAVWVDGTVWVQGSTPGTYLDHEELTGLMQDVMSLAEVVATRVPKEFGGRPNNTREPSGPPSQGTRASGPYL